MTKYIFMLICNQTGLLKIFIYAIQEQYEVEQRKNTMVPKVLYPWKPLNIQKKWVPLTEPASLYTSFQTLINPLYPRKGNWGEVISQGTVFLSVRNQQKA